MRHNRDHRRLGRKAEHRRALLRNLVTALFQYERIETTVAKAKEARRVAERMITFGKKGDLAARRHVARFVNKPEVVGKLFDTIAPWYATRQGGYTRILKIGRRLGDAGEVAYLELVKSEEQRERERQARIAAAEAKALAKSNAAGRAEKKAKAASESEATVEEAPKRGRKKESGAGGGAKTTKRTTPRKVGN